MNSGILIKHGHLEPINRRTNPHYQAKHILTRKCQHPRDSSESRLRRSTTSWTSASAWFVGWQLVRLASVIVMRIVAAELHINRTVST